MKTIGEENDTYTARHRYVVWRQRDGKHTLKEAVEDLVMSIRNGLLAAIKTEFHSAVRAAEMKKLRTPVDEPLANISLNGWEVTEGISRIRPAN